MIKSKNNIKNLDQVDVNLYKNIFCRSLNQVNINLYKDLFVPNIMMKVKIKVLTKLLVI